MHKYFKNSESAAIARFIAVIAAFAPHEICPRHLARVKVQDWQLGLRGLAGRGAFFAYFAHQPLRHQGADGGGDQEGLHSDVNQTGDGAGGVVGVQGGENQVAGERRVDGDGGRFHVANFPEHDDVGRLAQHGPQRRRETSARQFR